MPLSLNNVPRVLLVTLAAFALTAAVLFATRGDDPSLAGAGASALPSQPRPGATTDERIAAYAAIVKARPRVAAGYTLLAGAYAQKARDTGDGAFTTRAETVIARGLRVAPADPGLLTERGALAMSRHDFRAGLRDARAVVAAEPALRKPYGVLVDALVELGRYDEARRALQRMIDLGPGLAAYARASYFAELQGDVAGAREALKLAASAGGETAENVAYVQTLLGNLEFAAGDLDRARAAYREALARFPGYAGARVGLAKVDLARGRPGAAIAELRSVVGTAPVGEYLALLGDAELVAGRAQAARGRYAQVNEQHRQELAAGLNPDAGLVLFEAEHGDRARALSLGRKLWQVAPSVSSAHALSWALTRNGRAGEGLEWARRSLKLGSRDAMFLFHAGITARDAGRPDLARRWLAMALEPNPRFSPLYAPRARRALDALS
jgi:pentatricopeptide repeat protein